jgi:predicted amidophosphoribosyltransferase
MSSLRQCGSCLRHPPPVDRTIAALDYACPWDRLLQHFKFNDGIELHERAANMHQAFAVEPARQRDLRGSHVAIVDDVMTRGATLFELARVLRRAGATKVQAWVIARTPGPKD